MARPLPLCSALAVLLRLFAVATPLTCLVSCAAPPFPPVRSPAVESHPAPRSAKDDLLNGDFTLITDVAALPPSVLKADGAELMANPGATWNSSDAIFDLKIPRRRLILAGRSGDRYFVHYEQGGFALRYQVGIFALKGDSAEKLWSGECPRPARTLDGLRHEIATGDCR